MDPNNFNWSASDYMKSLTESNKLANSLGARFAQVSGLQGFQECLATLKKDTCIVAVSDIADGKIETENTPHIQRMKCVYLALRHPIDDMNKRTQALRTLEELFRQFLSKMMQEKTLLEELNIYMSDNIRFSEINKYFFSGMACAYFQLDTTSFCNLEYNPEEWQQ